jgi:outer membrane protein W
MKKFAVVSIVLAMAVAASAPFAHAKGLPPNYVALKLGGFFPQSGDLDDIDADAGFNGEIALGHYIAPGFSIEGALGYFETKGSAPTPLGRVDEKFEVIPLTISLRGQVPYGRFEPYGFLGLGVYFIDDKISIPVLGSDSDSDASLGFHVGFGGSYALSNTMFLGIEARYLFLETDTFGVNFRLDGVTLTGNIGVRF